MRLFQWCTNYKAAKVRKHTQKMTSNYMTKDFPSDEDEYSSDYETDISEDETR